MRKLLKNKHVRRALIAIAIFVLVFIIISEVFGAGEITLLNSKSFTDWKLGGSVDGISSPEDGKAAAPAPFVWFEDEDGKMGLRNDETGTCYYMAMYPTDNAGKFCVTGFTTKDKMYSVMDIRVGDSESSARAELLDSRFTIVAGGQNSCRASMGSVSIVLYFEHGTVVEISAYINK